MKRIAALSLLLLAGCKGGSMHSATEEKPPLPSAQPTLLEEAALDKDRRIGIWTDGRTAHATLVIQQDSLFYVDLLGAYKYSLEGDSVLIHYPDWVFRGKGSFGKDTLVITSGDGTAKYWRFTE